MLIYALSHPITGEIRYIGKSERGIIRPRQHGQLSHLKKRSHLPVARWVNKLRSQGLDYVIEVIETQETRESLMEAEKFWISQFRALGFRLLNICDGGEGFTGRHTPEAKAKISAAGLGRKLSAESIEKGAAKRRGRSLSDAHRRALCVPKSGAGAKGVPKSPEHRAAVSKGQKGKKLTKEHIAKMPKSKLARPFMDNFGKIYQYQMDAARALGVDQGSIRQVLKGKAIQVNGYVFAYLDDLKNGELPTKRPRQKKLTPKGDIDKQRLKSYRQSPCKDCNDKFENMVLDSHSYSGDGNEIRTERLLKCDVVCQSCLAIRRCRRQGLQIRKTKGV